MVGAQDTGIATTMRLILAALAILLSLAPAAMAAESGRGQARTVVMSAFPPEMQALEAAARDRREHAYAGVRFVTGTLEGKPVVLLLSGVSMVNAARTTQLALDHFNVRRIVFSGVGGGVDPSLHVGDVVVAAQWSEYLEMTFARAAAPADQDPTRFGMMVPGPVTLQRWPAEAEHRTWFPADPTLLEAARRAAKDVTLKQCEGQRCLPAPPRIIVGGNGVSGSAFVDNAAFRQFAFATFKADVLDMESAAVAHVAYLNRTPFIAFRSLSDLAGGDPGANQFPMFVKLASDNSAAAVRRFLREAR